MELSKLWPPGRWGPSLKEHKKLAPSTKAMKIQARCGMGLQLLRIFTYEKSHVHVEMTKSAFPLVAPLQSTGLSSGVERVSQPF